MAARLIIAGVLSLVVLAGITLYLAQAIQPEVETVVEIIPNDKFDD